MFLCLKMCNLCTVFTGVQVKPYIPYEWTPAGMLERVNALVTNQVNTTFIISQCMGLSSMALYYFRLINIFL